MVYAIKMGLESELQHIHEKKQGISEHIRKPDLFDFLGKFDELN